MKPEAHDTINLLNRLLINIDLYDTYELMLINNTIQNIVIEAYKAGKIDKEVADKILFPEEV